MGNDVSIRSKQSMQINIGNDAIRAANQGKGQGPQKKCGQGEQPQQCGKTGEGGGQPEQAGGQGKQGGGDPVVQAFKLGKKIGKQEAQQKGGQKTAAFA